jgi:3-deoxy-D-manno-octulosonic-acid transferase
VLGPDTFNFAEAFAALRAADALASVDDATALGASVLRLLTDRDAARAAGAQGRAVFEREGGATQRTLAPLLSLLDRSAPRVQASEGQSIVWADPQRLPTPQAEHFTPAHWQARQAATPLAAGRNTVWFVHNEHGAMVLRHYWRGGWVARWSRDAFLREPLPRSRAMAEYALLQRLCAWGLAVPRPCGAHWQPAGPLHYRADILVERIDGAMALSARLQQAPLSPVQWQAVGAAIARLHAHGVFHSDLNCHNLLLDAQDRVWILAAALAGQRTRAAPSVAR